jgi:valyl-tRNA synthetase
MEAYDFSTATQTAYAWWQYELCDVFIELMKPVMARDEAADPGAAATWSALGKFVFRTLLALSCIVVWAVVAYASSD